jgi:glycosyl transferase/beta-hydroxylase protein BlmF
MDRMNFVTVMRTGGDFRMADVISLKLQLDRHCPVPFRVWCLTNAKGSLLETHGITPLSLRYDSPGKWAKMELFRPKYTREYCPAVFLDLDTVIVGDLDWMAELDPEEPPLMLRDFHHPERAGASGMLYLPPTVGVYTDIWREWRDARQSIMGDYGIVEDDGHHIAHTLPHYGHWQDRFPGRIVSFKPTRDTRLEEVPPGVSVVCFHGSPRPWEVSDWRWMPEHYIMARSGTHTPRRATPQPRSPRYPHRHKGTLLVVGSGPGAMDEYVEARHYRPEAMVATLGHAAGMVKADFVVTDHYEVHEDLRELQSKFGPDFTTHCTRCSNWHAWPAVDYWWDWVRAAATSAETAIRIGLSMGFGEIILCGCPLEASAITHPAQRAKDGDEWPPPRDMEKYSPKPGWNTSEEILESYQTNFFLRADEWRGKVFSMSGFTRNVLGSPPLVRDRRALGYCIHPEDWRDSPAIVSVLCPTLGRPQKAVEFAQSAIKTAFGPVEVWLYVDDDDPKAREYALAFGPNRNPNIHLLVGPPGRVGRAWNTLAERCHGDLLMMGNDDQVFVTRGWDSILKSRTQRYEDRVFVAWFDDGTGKAADRCAFPIVSRRWYETLGEFVPERFHFLYHDTWVADIGRKVRRLVYIPRVLVRHDHFSVTGNSMDATYRRHRVSEEARVCRQEDKQTYATGDIIRKEQAQKLRAIMGRVKR